MGTWILVGMYYDGWNSLVRFAQEAVFLVSSVEEIVDVSWLQWKGERDQGSLTGKEV